MHHWWVRSHRLCQSCGSQREIHAGRTGIELITCIVEHLNRPLTTWYLHSNRFWAFLDSLCFLGLVKFLRLDACYMLMTLYRANCEDVACVWDFRYNKWILHFKFILENVKIILKNTWMNKLCWSTFI